MRPHCLDRAVDGRVDVTCLVILFTVDQAVTAWCCHPRHRHRSAGPHPDLLGVLCAPATPGPSTLVTPGIWSCCACHQFLRGVTGGPVTVHPEAECPKVTSRG
jgi:hypothetical protein